MDLVFEIQEMAKHLDEDKKILILEIMKNFLPDEEVMPYDAHYIALAEHELATGQHGSWDNIK